MDENLRMFIILMTFLIIGGIGGFLLNETIHMQEYAKTCNTQCQAYMSRNCICAKNGVGIITPEFNYTEGGTNERRI
jgi:hypothetical protein